MQTSVCHLTMAQDSWPIKGRFTISRGTKTRADVVVVSLTRGQTTGRGESVPYQRYGESLEQVMADVLAFETALASGAERQALQRLMRPGAARNAIDCAFWDLEAKEKGQRAWTYAGLSSVKPVPSYQTLSLETLETMVTAAKALKTRSEIENWPDPLRLKLKIADLEDVMKVEAIRNIVPQAHMIVDANEAFDLKDLNLLARHMQRLKILLIEQPLAAGDEAALQDYNGSVPLCADESLKTREDLLKCSGFYQVLNIKLDKTGGLTEALALKQQAQQQGFQIMVGCMVATSLSMAPAFLLANDAAYVDLDGPLILAEDREFAMTYRQGLIDAPDIRLWG